MSRYNRFKKWIEEKRRYIHEADIVWLFKLFEEEEAKGKDPDIIGEGDTFSKEGYYLLRVMDMKTKNVGEVLVDKKIISQMYDPTNGWGVLVTKIVDGLKEE